ncbi:MAG: hypothetical protein MRJ93_04710 [Nitrososphaeraceae archaeon]|nr:hypothetical protein [Nitrososphaeraceae archaeon]
MQISSQISAYRKFEYGLKSPATKRQYPKRLEHFLDFLDLSTKESSIEDKVNTLYIMIQDNGREWFEDKLMQFFQLQNERVQNGEMSINTITNYYKPIKLFCLMNGIIANWDLISKGIVKGNQVSEDRPPTMQEIQQLVKYPDIRVEMIVSVMISSGIRSGSWDYLKWKDLTPIDKNGVIVAAKLRAFNTKTKKYYNTFITAEAYNLVKNYMDFRQSHGEKINGEAWLVRDLWRIKSQRFGNYLGLAQAPKRLTSHGIRMLISNAWKVQGIRNNLENGQTRFEFKTMHGFRKFFETECQKKMKSLTLFLLMDHDTGIVKHYNRPREDELLDDYLNAVHLLTVNEENRLTKQVQELKKKDEYQKYLIDKKIDEKDKEIAEMKEKLNKYEEYDKIMNNLLIKFEKWEREQKKQKV